MPWPPSSARSWARGRPCPRCASGAFSRRASARSVRRGPLRRARGRVSGAGRTRAPRRRRAAGGRRQGHAGQPQRIAGRGRAVEQAQVGRAGPRRPPGSRRGPAPVPSRRPRAVGATPRVSPARVRRPSVRRAARARPAPLRVRRGRPRPNRRTPRPGLLPRLPLPAGAVRRRLAPAPGRPGAGVSGGGARRAGRGTARVTPDLSRPARREAGPEGSRGPGRPASRPCSGRPRDASSGCPPSSSAGRAHNPP